MWGYHVYYKKNQMEMEVELTLSKKSSVEKLGVLLVCRN